MITTGHDSLRVRDTLDVQGKRYDFFSLPKAYAALGDGSRLPFSLKILLENLLRFEDGRTTTTAQIKQLLDWQKTQRSSGEISYRPGRVLLQDFTGVPAIVDLAAMRQAMQDLGGDPQRINPLSPVDLVIDHSVMIDHFGDEDAFGRNVAREFERNGERYAFLRWGQQAFDNFRVVPPGTGICHQVNIEYLARTVWSDTDQNGQLVAYPDTLVGADSHTTMVNALGVLGWGVGGIEAEAAMLGQPISLLIPEVVGFELKGRIAEGVTATDLVLRVVEMLRAHGVVGKFVEFFGDGLGALSLADRATIANMAPEYGATCGIFPIDAETLHYLRFTGRESETVALVEAYAKAQGLWHDGATPVAMYTDTLSLDLGEVVPALAGPRRPQDRVLLSNMRTSFEELVRTAVPGGARRQVRYQDAQGQEHVLEDGSVVIAAITSCTNTSNPAVLVAAGLLARNAVARGLESKPWVKTSLAPGSQVVSDYLKAAGLQTHLDALGFSLVGYGCTTCIGNSGPLPAAINEAITGHDLVVASVLSGNRNFEGRVHPMVKANYLASPPLVVAYALAGSLHVDLTTEPLGIDSEGRPVLLKDIWPSDEEIRTCLEQALTPAMFRTRYGDVFTGPDSWRSIETPQDETYQWNSGSTYVQYPPYFEGMGVEAEPPGDIVGARALLILGDSVTTDHISPAGSFKPDTPAGEFLLERQVRPQEFNSFGARRGNHEIMMRGTFGNIRIRNELLESTSAAGREGGWSCYEGEVMPVYEAAMRYKAAGVPLVVFGGQAYGTGSSRDWAAKGTALLGVRAVIVENFERIHRSNLVGMGVLPLEFPEGVTRKTLGLTGAESFDLRGIEALEPRGMLRLTIYREDGEESVELRCRIDTLDELDYYRHGGILPYVLRNLLEAA